ncbi:transposase [Rhizobium ruizarguesonis]
MIRTDLPDRQWEKIAPHCHGKDTDPGRSGGNNRLFLEAVLWKARTNSPWRVSPASVSGASSSNFRCFQHLRCAARLHRRLAEAAQRVFKGVVRLVSALVRRRCWRTTFTGSRAVKAPYRI